MTKKEFLELLKENGKLKSKVEAEAVTNAFLTTIEEILVKGESVSFIGFGKFECAERAARTCKNPQTGKEMQVPAKKVAKFKAGKTLTEKLNTKVCKSGCKSKKK